MADPRCIDCENTKIHAKGLCLRCYGKHSMRKFRALNPEKNHKRKREWYLKNKEKVCFFRRRSRILKNYNMTLEDLENMELKQNRKCLICNEKLPLKIDHDHATGKVRGLLCDLCNRGLGYFKDNPKLLVNAAEYILDSKKQEGSVTWTRT